jgi:hypothetical protein
MIENWTYNINEQHSYADLKSNYKIVYADTKINPLYTIKSDQEKTGPTFEITDEENFTSSTDYYHRLHVCRFPVGSTCFNGLEDGLTLHTMRVLSDNTSTTINNVSVGIRLNFSTGIENYRFPVEYLNGVDITLTDNGGTVIGPETTRMLGATAQPPTPNYTYAAPRDKFPSTIDAADLTPTGTVVIGDIIGLNPVNNTFAKITNDTPQNSMEWDSEEYNLISGYAIFENVPIDDTDPYTIDFEYPAGTPYTDTINVNDRNGVFKEIELP